MKITVNNITDKKIRIQEDIPAKNWEMDSDFIKFTGLIHVDCQCFKADAEILVSAKVTSQREITCSRCLAAVEQVFTQNFCRSYSVKTAGDELDLAPDMREEILLNFPMKVLCSDDCKGICIGCGVNLNSGSCRCQNDPKPSFRINKINY